MSGTSSSVWVPGFPSIAVWCGFVPGWEGWRPGVLSWALLLLLCLQPRAHLSCEQPAQPCQPMTLCHHHNSEAPVTSKCCKVKRKYGGNNGWWKSLTHKTQSFFMVFQLSVIIYFRSFKGQCQWWSEFFVLNHI